MASLTAPPSPAAPPVTKHWAYRVGFGGTPLLTCRASRDRPRLGEVIAARGRRWRVYDWVASRREVTLFVEQVD